MAHAAAAPRPAPQAAASASASAQQWDAHDALACMHPPVPPAQWAAFMAEHTVQRPPDARQRRPQVIMMVGLPGSGKTGTRALCAARAKAHFTLIDPDVLLETFFDNDAACYAHVDRLQELWKQHCMQHKLNIILDGTGKNLLPKFASFRAAGYSIMLCINLADVQLCKQRAAEREKETRRAVSPDFVDAVDDLLRQQLDAYLHHRDVHDVWMYANDDHDPSRRRVLCSGKETCQKQLLLCPAHTDDPPLKSGRAWLRGYEWLLHVHHLVPRDGHRPRRQGPRLRAMRRFGLVRTSSHGWQPVRCLHGPHVRRKYAAWAARVRAAGWPPLPPLPLAVQPRPRTFTLAVPLSPYDTPGSRGGASEALRGAMWVPRKLVKSPFSTRRLGRASDEDAALRAQLLRAILLTEPPAADPAAKSTPQ